MPDTPIEDEEHLLATPLSFYERIIGAMLVSRISKPPFTQEDFRLFNGFAAQITIENARLHEKLERYTHALEATVEARTAQVEQQSKWLETILLTVQDALIVTDCAGIIRMANPSALRLTERPTSELVGKPLQSILEHMMDDSTSWSGGIAAPARGHIQLHDRHYQYSVAIFEDIKTEPLCSVFMLTDITPLQNLNNLKLQMIRIASHDLRSLMSSMGLRCHMMRRSLDKDPEKIAAHIDRLEASLAELKGMVSDLLEVE